jgi:proteasome accessory factor C
MSKNISAPLLRTARLLDLVPFLNTHQGIALKDLAKYFEVTPTQMSADLTTLWMCGLPGYTPLELMDLEFESGYVSIRNAATLSKPRTISFQEGVVLLLGLDLIEASLPNDREDLLGSVQSLRQRLRQKVDIPIQFSVVTGTAGSVTTTIAQALQSNQGVSISYHSLYKDQISVRTVIPINLYHSGNHQYVRAYCLTALDYREFRIDRITQAECIAVSAVQSSKESDLQRINFYITIKDSSRDVTERFDITEGTIGSSIELSSYSRQWIERSVMASGGAIFLSSPSEIRAEIAKKARLMLNRYKEA